MAATAPAPEGPTPSFAEVLEPWCAAGVTGVLRLPGRSGGAVYLVDGDLTYAESRYACGLGRLLPASGRLSAADVRDAAHGAAPMADLLTAPGLFTAAELEAAVTAALYGAAMFLFDTRRGVRVEIGVRHPVGAVARVGFAAARVEVDRRRRELYRALPDATVDTTPVAPVRRLDGDAVTLTPLRWEILVAAGRRGRTPVDLARALGRDTYAVLLDARRMVADGLLRVVPPAPTPLVAGERKAHRRRGPAVRKPTADPPPAKAPRGGRHGTAATEPPLPRRAGDTPVPPRVLPDAVGPDAFPDSVLLRIRDALRALT